VARTLSLWLPVVAFMGVIFFLSSLSEPPVPEEVGSVGGHWIGYFLLAVLVVRALAGGLPARVALRIALLAWLISVGYGVTDELHQTFVPGRTADIYDIYTDALGAAAGIAVCWAWGILSRVSRLDRSRRDV
jgi:VanZ family protein